MTLDELYEMVRETRRMYAEQGVEKTPEQVLDELYTALKEIESRFGKDANLKECMDILEKEEKEKWGEK